MSDQNETLAGAYFSLSSGSTIFIVIEDDRGMGETLLAAYRTRQEADDRAKESDHYYVQECPFFSSNHTWFGI